MLTKKSHFCWISLVFPNRSLLWFLHLEKVNAFELSVRWHLQRNSSKVKKDTEPIM